MSKLTTSQFLISRSSRTIDNQSGMTKMMRQPYHVFCTTLGGECEQVKEITYLSVQRQFANSQITKVVCWSELRWKLKIQKPVILQSSPVKKTKKKKTAMFCEIVETKTTANSASF